MSHVTATATAIPESQFDTLIDACKEMGLTFIKGQKTFKWYGRWVNDYDATNAAYKLGINPSDYGKCDHAIVLPGCNYEIGLVKDKKTGNYLLVYDFFGEGQKIRAKIGDACQKLTNLQGVKWAEKYAKKHKLKLKKTNKSDGSIELSFT